MKKFMQRIMLALAAISTVSVITLAPAYAATNQAKNDVCAGAALAGANCGSSTGGTGLESILATILNVLSFVAGAAAVIMIIIAGLKYITSQGDPSAVKSAKDSLLYAIIGVAVVALSQFIVQFVLSKVK